MHIKRSMAPLAVAAGLLAATAGPANAQVLPGTIGLSAPAPARTVTCLDQDLNTLRHDPVKAMCWLPEVDDEVQSARALTDGTSNTIMFG